MILRKMKKEDIPSVEKIERELFTDAWSSQGFLDTLLSEHALTLVAEEDVLEGDKIAGYLVMYKSFEEGEISKVAVSKNVQQRGIGSALLEGMLKEGEKSSVTRFVLEVRASNQPAIALYKKFGFENIGIRRGFYENPREDAIIMILEKETERC